MKQKDENNKKEVVIRFGLVITVILFLVIIYVLFNRIIIANSKVNLSGENYYQYFSGMKEEYSGKIDIFQKEDDTQLILEDGRIVYVDSTPMYYKDVLGKTIFLKDVQLVLVDGKTYKLDPYTNVIMENNQINLKKVNRDNIRNVENAFIFDGEDMYFLLEETEVQIGSKTYKLSPLSYVKVNYRNNVEIYDYDKDQYTMLEDEEDIVQDVIAVNNYRNYKINMSLDTLSTEKTEQLLISNIKNLEPYLN